MQQKALDEKYCANCGEIIKLKAEICPKCGVRQIPLQSVNTSSSKNRTTAALLALLLGGIGAHKFYLGETGKGLIYLLFFWTFIPVILALIDAIRFFGMKDSEINQLYPV